MGRPWSREREEAIRDFNQAYPLWCKVCKRTYHYHLRRINIGKAPGEATIGDVVECKGCEGLFTSEITEDTLEAITIEIGRLALFLDKEEEAMPTSALEPVTKEIQALGRKVSTLSEAHQILKDALDREPENVDLNQRMGNLFKNGGRPDLAIPYYGKVLSAEPRNRDTLACLSESLIDTGRLEEAASYVGALPEFLRDPDLTDSGARDLFNGIITMAADLQSAGVHVEIRPAASLPDASGGSEPTVLSLYSMDLGTPEGIEDAYQLFRGGVQPKHGHKGTIISGPPAKMEPVRVEHVGRNEPCPCGSGKKYKRCCGS